MKHFCNRGFRETDFALKGNRYQDKEKVSLGCMHFYLRTPDAFRYTLLSFGSRFLVRIIMLSVRF